MCLVSKTDKPLIAEDDIVCYKILDRCDSFSCEYRTPFMGMKVRNAVLTGRCLMKARGKREIIRAYLGNNSYRYEVNGGYIHTYKHVPFYSYDIGDIVFECVIPKGEEYYKSYDGTEYASRSIRFIKQVL